MRRSVQWVAVAVTILAAGVQAQTIQVDKNNRTIAITATDKATAEADVAVVTVGFEVYAPDAPSAYQKGSAISNAVMDALKKAGVADKAIESKEQSLTHTEFPEGDKSTPEERARKQFTLSQSWTVRATAASAGPILHTAIEAGANESGNVEWELSSRDALQAKAAALALERARAIAGKMAEGLNAHLGSLIYASNQAPLTPIQRVLYTSEATVSVNAAPAPPPPRVIRPQEVEESATVYAVFAID